VSVGNENNGANKTANPDWTATDIKMVEILGKIREAHPDFLMGEQISDEEIDMEWEVPESIRYEEGYIKGEKGSKGDNGGKRKKSRVGGIAAAIVAVVLVFAAASAVMEPGMFHELRYELEGKWREAKVLLTRGGESDGTDYVVTGDGAQLTIRSMDRINAAKAFMPSLVVPGALPEGFGMESITIYRSEGGGYYVDYYYSDIVSGGGRIHISCVNSASAEGMGHKFVSKSSYRAGNGAGFAGKSPDGAGRGAGMAVGAGEGASAEVGAGLGDAEADAGEGADTDAGAGLDGAVAYEIRIPDGVVPLVSDIGGVGVYTCDDGQTRSTQFVLGDSLFLIEANSGEADYAVDSITATMIAGWHGN
jgi:hypothetical protein